MSDLVDVDDSNAGELGRPRVQLGDLPHEIKDLIVRHCHGADDSIDFVIQSLARRGGLPADSDCSLDDLRKMYRRTVAVLYEVSKEWRSLCAPYRFEFSSDASSLAFTTAQAGEHLPTPTQPQALDCLVAPARPDKAMQSSRASADETNNSRTVARPRVQLSDLPAELKGKIAQQCHAADVRLEECIEDVSERVGDSLPARLARVRSVRGSHGHSIGALYAVSKDWKNACAPYRFEGSSTWSKHYRCSRTFKGSRSGFTLNMLEQECGSHLEDLVLARLSSAVWGVVRELVLVNLSLQQVLHVAGSAPLLTKLELKIYEEEVLTNLWHILDATPGLKYLRMSFAPMAFDDSRDEPLDLKILIDTKPTSIVPLSTITLESAEILTNTGAFLALFSPDLHSVTVQYRPLIDPEDEPAAAQPSALPTCTLPKLQILTLIGPPHRLLPTLDGITSALLPRLRILTVDCRPADPAWSSASSAIVDRVKSIAAGHDKLEIVKVSHPSARLDSRHDQIDNSARHGPKMLNLPSVYPLLAKAEPDASVQHCTSDNALDYVDKLLEAGMDWRTRARATGDQVGLGRLAKALQPLDFERMLHEM